MIGLEKLSIGYVFMNDPDPKATIRFINRMGF